MPEVTVLYKVKTGPVRENIDRELLWYDDLKKEMMVFSGGKLDFEYKEDEYLVGMGSEERKRKGITTTFRMLPKVGDLEVVNYNKIKTTTNEKEVKKWFDDYVNYNITNASIVWSNRDGITVDVSNEELDDFLYQAERYSLRTRI